VIALAKRLKVGVVGLSRKPFQVPSLVFIDAQPLRGLGYPIDALPIAASRSQQRNHYATALYERKERRYCGGREVGLEDDHRLWRKSGFFESRVPGSPAVIEPLIAEGFATPDDCLALQVGGDNVMQEVDEDQAPPR
jgi:hypothetical protein